MKINPRIQICISSTVCCAFGFLSLFLAPSLHADTLAYWNMNAAGTAKANVNTVGSGVTVTPIGTVNLNAIGTVVPVFNPALVSGDNYAGMSRSSGPTPETVSLAQDYANSTYFQFTLAPSGGQLLDLTSLSFNVVAATTTTTANREFFMESDKTGFGTTSANVLYGGATQSALNPGGGINWSGTLIPFNDTAANTGPYGETLFSVDLSGNSLLQNISDSVTFRFYIGTDTTSQNLGFDNLTVGGLIAPVPEPSTVVMLGLGAFALLAIRGRCRQA